MRGSRYSMRSLPQRSVDTLGASRAARAAGEVDEILFEHPYWFDGFNFGWGKVRSPNTHTVDDVLALMRRLREVGVRSHFWV